MRRIKLKDLLNEAFGRIQQPGTGGAIPKWITYYNDEHPDNKSQNERLYYIANFLIDVMYLMGERLAYLSIPKTQQFSMSRHPETGKLYQPPNPNINIRDHVQELKDMLRSNKEMLEYIKQRFPLYYKKLDEPIYRVISTFKQIDAQLRLVINNPDSETASDDLEDCAHLYSVYSEEAVEARNDTEIINYLKTFSGRMN
jgi:hypothetical protein